MNLTVPQAAKRYNCSEQHLRKLVAGGTIKAVKMGPIWLLNERSAVAYFAKERKSGVKPKVGRNKE